MRIRNITATPVTIPLEAPMYWAAGLYTGTSMTIIEVETDTGVTGIGEAPSHECAGLINETMGPKLTGCDPVDIESCERVCVPETKIEKNISDDSCMKAFGGVELALWDIRGKLWNEPIYNLLGGAFRKEIPFTEYFAFREKEGDRGGEETSEAVADYCVRMRNEHGSTMFEGKLGSLGDPDLEIETVKLLREKLGPKAVIRLDGNMCWSLDTARYIMKKLEPYNVRNYEDPVATFEELHALRRSTTIPFSTHNPDIRRATALGVPDNFVTNLPALGGIRRGIQFIGACEAMGIGYWFYSGDAGVASAAYLHVAAACGWIREPSQSLFRWQVDDVIEGGPFSMKNNVIKVPEGPGLGIKLSREGLKRCHKRFVDEGPAKHFCDPSNPNMYRRLPLV